MMNQLRKRLGGFRLWLFDDPLACKVGLHDEVTVLTASEIYLRCQWCQKRSDGWDVIPIALTFLQPRRRRFDHQHVLPFRRRA